MPATSSQKQKLFQQLFAVAAKPRDAGPAPDAPAGPGEPDGRPVLEQMIYAICREGTTREKADRAYKGLRDGFFDWNEVRVSSPREVADALGELPAAEPRAQRIIDFLQEVFETTFSFDLEGLHKKGLKIAAKQLARYQVAGDYHVAWVVQQSLGGHAIPLDEPSLRTLRRLGVVDPEQTDHESVRASLEHQVPKAKGPGFTEAVSLIAGEYCLEDQPLCQRCPMTSVCLKLVACPRPEPEPAVAVAGGKGKSS